MRGKGTGLKNPFSSVEQLGGKPADSTLRAMTNALGAASFLSKLTAQTADSKLEKSTRMERMEKTPKMERSAATSLQLL